MARISRKRKTQARRAPAPQGRRKRPPPARLTIAQILAWADAHHTRTGRWPIKESGPIVGGNGDKWITVDAALRAGGRGLKQRSSLAQLLAARRGVRNKLALPRFRILDILAWADAYYRKHKRWPRFTSGKIPESPGDEWKTVEAALQLGFRGLPGGSSIPRLLAAKRGTRNQRQLPPLTHRQILAWADAFHRRTGKWPTARYVPVKEAPQETWHGVAATMGRGARGLPRLTLPQLLARERGVRRKNKPPRLSYRQILAWADAWHRRTGKWPQLLSGPIPGAPGETWTAIGSAMQWGARGLCLGYTLAQLLSDQRGVRNIHGLPPLSVPQILAWARHYRSKHGSLPHLKSGPIKEAPGHGETWRTINTALAGGYRGLPGGTTLRRLLGQSRISTPGLGPIVHRRTV